MTSLPAWCRSVPGDGRTLVVAPHGGLCASDLLHPGRALRGNDLHTDQVARLLAARLDATLVANAGVDRNELDLNRIDEVAERAPWFLDLLHDHLQRIVARFGSAVVLIVHGWQIVEPRCEVGVGARLDDLDDASRKAARLTVSASFASHVLARLRDAGARAGVRTTFGERWPARHANNVMQLFRRVPPSNGAGEPPLRHPLCELARAGCVEAVQLELGAPLRWAGSWRDRFIDAAAEAFASEPAPQSVLPVSSTIGAGLPGEQRAASSARAMPIVPAARAATPTAHTTVAVGAAADASPPPAVSLQAFAFDGDGAELGIVVGLGAMSRDEIGARLLLLPGAQRMLLFTGHERAGRAAPGRVGGLATCADGAGGVVVRYRGPVLDLPDASRHFRSEAAQLAARIADLELELRYTPLGEGGYGAIVGEAFVDGTRRALRGHGFTEPVLARPVAREPRATRLTAAFGGDLGVVAQLTGAPTSTRLRCLTSRGERAHALDVAPAPRIVPGRLAPPFELHARSGPALRCTPLGHVTILRTTPDGVPLHVTFGAARYELDDGRTGTGFYEHGASPSSAPDTDEEP